MGIDWSLFQFLNGTLRDHPAYSDYVEDFVTYWAVPVFVVGTLSLWVLDRPHRSYRWRIACVSALASAGLGLALSQLITHLWVRERPFAAHPQETFLLVPPSPEPSFPSDHAVAAFAIAFSVLLVCGRRAGALFLSAAFLVGMTRVLVGVHYPGDVLGGLLVGLAAALIVWYVGRGRWAALIRPLSRLTDPILEPAWQSVEVALARLRGWRSG